MDIKKIRDFEVEGTIGTGGMAAVYLARQTGSGRKVALKLMHPHLATDPVFVQRFMQEVKATTGLTHPNIIEVVACGEETGRYYMASEFIDAGTVGDLLKAVHKFPAAIAADLTLQVLMGLGFAHERGIVHRDIKPANLMLTSQGVLKVGDFGIAKTASSAALTQTGNLIGTPAYMSPEQAAGQPIDARSDLFSVGVVAYELLTGFNPYLGENESTTLLKILKSTPRIVFEADPTVPPALENILERLLERDPARRYQSAREALADLQPLVAAERQKSPGLVSEFIRDPVNTKRRLHDAQAQLYLWQANERLKQGPAERYQAALDVYRAVLLAPENREAEQLLKQLSAENKLNFDAPRNPKILELEAMVEQAPDSAGVLMQLASLYRMEGNLYKAVACFKRVLKLRPNDGYVQGQLSILTGQKTQNLAMPTVNTGVRAPATGARPAPNAPTTGLHTGKTGEVYRPNRFGPAPTQQTQAPQPEIPGFKIHEHDEPSTAQLLWNAWGRKLIGAAVVLGLFWLGLNKLGNSINSMTEEADKASQLFAKERDARERTELLKVADRQGAELEAKYGEEAETAFGAAKALALDGKHAEAAEAFAKVVEEYPKRPQAIPARLWRAKSLLASENPAAAIAQLDELESLHRGHQDAIEGLALKAEAHLELNQNGEATAAATQLLADYAASPFAGRARLARAKAAKNEGNFEDARKDAQWITGQYTKSDPLYGKAEAVLRALDGDEQPAAPMEATAPPLDQ